MPRVQVFILPPDIINLKYHRLNVELKVMTFHQQEGRRVIYVFGHDLKNGDGYRMNLTEGTVASSNAVKIDQLFTKTKVLLGEESSQSSQSSVAMDVMCLLDYLILGIKDMPFDKLKERADKLIIEPSGVNPVINYRCLGQLLSHQVSGDEILKGLKVEGFDISGRRLKENYLSGWNYERSGEVASLTELLLQPSLQNPNTGE